MTIEELRKDAEKRGGVLLGAVIYFPNLKISEDFEPGAVKLCPMRPTTEDEFYLIIRKHFSDPRNRTILDQT